VEPAFGRDYLIKDRTQKAKDIRQKKMNIQYPTRNIQHRIEEADFVGTDLYKNEPRMNTNGHEEKQKIANAEIRDSR
jgi:hypothetical protein